MLLSGGTGKIVVPTELHNAIVIPQEATYSIQDKVYVMKVVDGKAVASITIYFEQGANADMAAVNVQNRVIQAQTQLPAEVLQTGVATEKRQPGQLRIIALESPSDIFAVLAEQNIEASVGSLGSNSDNVFQYMLRYTGRKTEVSEFENLVIASLPKDVKIVTFDNTNDFLFASIREVILTLVIAFCWCWLWCSSSCRIFVLRWFPPSALSSRSSALSPL
jgi:multidrug efflux pump subunit AcrB